MATRALVQIRGKRGKVFLEKLMDGYPEAVIPDLRKVVGQMKGRMAEEVGGFAAWLIVNNMHISETHPVWYPSLYIPTTSTIFDAESYYDYHYIVNTVEGKVTIYGRRGASDTKKIV